ncbi:beta-galactosidase [Streptomyces sp. NPDC002851]
MTEFRVGDTDFELDGRPVRLLSGALHYFRVHEEHWHHRLAMLRALGLNCVETYVPWNLHQPGRDRFHDVAAVSRFLDAVHTAGLWAIVRPGPYICAEWDNGGLPHWVTGPLGRRVRTRDPQYLAYVDRWFAELLPHITPHQIDGPGPGPGPGGPGGPVIMLQVENEYGSYGSDHAYLRHLTDLLRRHGVTVPLCTSDGPEDHMLTGGSVPDVPDVPGVSGVPDAPGVLATANFGSRARESFAALRRHQAKGPLMCMEFWCGWFDHWGADPVVRDPADAADALRDILDCGASANLYMAHGGTNFAGWAGANRAGELHDGRLLPDVTSYDYDAPIDELGRPTAKFHAFREVLAAYADGPLPELPPAPGELRHATTAAPTAWVHLPTVLDTLGGPEHTHGTPPTFEDLDIDRGLVRYRVTVPGPRQPYPLTVHGLHDRAYVTVDGTPAAVLTDPDATLPEPVPGPAEVELWVESLGRVNYGPRLGEPKGITGGLRHERQYLHGIRARGLRLDALDDTSRVRSLPFRPCDNRPDTDTRGLYRTTLTLTTPGDALLELPGWTRGFAWINGFNLGRYWSTAGPQTTLYVPGPVLHTGANDVWLLELEAATPTAQLRLAPPPPPH